VDGLVGVEEGGSGLVPGEGQIAFAGGSALALAPDAREVDMGDAGALAEGGAAHGHGGQQDDGFQSHGDPLSPIRCRVTRRRCGRARCSNRYMPCQVPSASRPFITGMERLTWVSAAL